VLVTSRLTLRVSGEQEFPVPPLTTPDLGPGSGRPGQRPTRPVAPADLDGCEAVELFVQRARAVKPDFALTEANAADVAAICHRLDGLPLAIELAAARSKILSPPALLARLDRRLQVLAGGPRDLPARLQTMRDAIAWSYDLLPPEEQVLFRRLAVFAGGCTLEAAEAISEGLRPGAPWAAGKGLSGETTSYSVLSPPPKGHPASVLDPLDGMASLVDKSLLRQEEQADGELRFRMLETIREFGVERLDAHGEAEATRRRHAAWALELAEQAEPALWGPEQVAWLDRLEAEHDNLRAALAWSEEAGDGATMLRIAGALWWFWQARGHLGEGRAWIGRALAAAGTEPGAPDGAGDAALTGARSAAIFGASLLAELQGHHAEATRLAEAGLAAGRARGDEACVARGVWMLSFAAGGRGDHPAAQRFAEQALAAFRALGDDRWTALALNRLGIETYEQGDAAAATPLFEDALARWRRQGHTWGVATVLANLAEIARDRGDVARAAGLYRESLELCWDQRDQWGLVEALVGLADIAGARGQAEAAVRLFGAADAVGEAIGLSLQPYVRARHDRALGAAKAALGADAFAAAWTAGRSLPLAHAVAEATAVSRGGAPAAPGAASRPPVVAPEPPPVGGTAGLTPRELEVLRLLAEGRSSREMADALFISHRTATTHVANILGKLGVDTRAAAVALAYRRGMV
jgi:non-specific serine/threonine protein kinase